MHETRRVGPGDGPTGRRDHGWAMRQHYTRPCPRPCMALFALGGVTVVAMVSLAFLAVVRVGSDAAERVQVMVLGMWLAYTVWTMLGGV